MPGYPMFVGKVAGAATWKPSRSHGGNGGGLLDWVVTAFENIAGALRPLMNDARSSAEARESRARRLNLDDSRGSAVPNGPFELRTHGLLGMSTGGARPRSAALKNEHLAASVGQWQLL